MFTVKADVIRRRPRPFIDNGNKIVRLRKLAGGQSQAVFAARAGISSRYWLQIETGEKLPSGRVRDRIAEALSCDPRELMSSDDDDEESDAVAALVAAIRALIREEAAELVIRR